MEIKHLSLSLAFLLGIIAVGAEQRNDQDFSDKEIRNKFLDKRSVQDNQPTKSQPGFWESFSSSANVEKTTGGQESAKEEKSFLDFSPYDSIQSILINALKPKPIVDTAEESELLAPSQNSKIQALGDLVVKGSETLSRALNSAIEVPKKAISTLSNGATKALNQLGAYIVGL